MSPTNTQGYYYSIFFQHFKNDWYRICFEALDIPQKPFCARPHMTLPGYEAKASGKHRRR